MEQTSKGRWLFWPIIFLISICSFFVETEIILLLSAVSISYFTAKYGIKNTAFGLIFLFLAGYIKNGIVSGVLIFIHALSAYSIGIFLYEKKKFSVMLILSTVIEVSVLAGYTYFICTQLNLKPVELLFGRTFEQLFEIASTYSRFDSIMIDELSMSLNYMKKMLQSMLPFLYLFSSLIYTYTLFSFTRFVLEKQNIKFNMPKFHELWLPGSISGIFVILFILSFFYQSPILINCISFVFALHLICGLSLTDYFMKGKGIPKAIRTVLLVLILAITSFLGGILSSILCCLGMSSETSRLRK